MKFKSPYIAFSAPSGAGKTTIIKRLTETYNGLKISISATTRKMRRGEEEGVSYYFLAEEIFQNKIKENLLLEYELVHGNYYGTLSEKVERIVASGKTVLFDIDVNGAIAMKQKFPNAVLIFIKPPSRAELIRRLRNRNSETENSIKKRISRLEYEYKISRKFDYIVVNDDLEKTIKRVEDIIIER
jgi:guanylate kinase